jgi:hypothetical protein
MLFKVEMLIDERRLGKVYAALDGLVYNLSAPIPVRNAHSSNGKVKETTPAGDFTTTVYGALKQRAENHQDIRSGEVKAAMKASGYKPSSYSYAIEKLVADKLMKRVKVGHYKLLGE